MDIRLIRKRVSSIDTSTASIVGMAAWCSLHIGTDAEAIVACIVDRVQSDDVCHGARTGCLLVLHEILLSCALHASAGGELGRQAVCSCIASRLPLAIRRVLSFRETPESKESLLEFTASVLKVTAWWNTPPLNTFMNKDKLKEMRAPVLVYYKKQNISSSPGTVSNITSAKQHLPETSLPAATSSSSSVMTVPKVLQGVARLLTKYEGAKERFDKLSGTDVRKEEVDDCREEAIRRLIFVIKALDGRDGESASSPTEVGLLASLHEDLIRLQNSAASAPPVMEEKDDLLGSFF